MHVWGDCRQVSLHPTSLGRSHSIRTSSYGGLNAQRADSIITLLGKTSGPQISFHHGYAISSHYSLSLVLDQIISHLPPGMPFSALVLLCSFGFGRRSRPTGRYCFWQSMQEQWSCHQAWVKSVFVETNKALLAATSLDCLMAYYFFIHPHWWYSLIPAC